MKTEPFAKEQVQMLTSFFNLGATPIDWEKIDYSIGRGILKGENRCLWTINGHRITVVVDRSNGVVAEQSRGIDPVYAELKA